MSDLVVAKCIYRKKNVLLVAKVEHFSLRPVFTRQATVGYKPVSDWLEMLSLDITVMNL